MIQGGRFICQRMIDPSQVQAGFGHSPLIVGRFKELERLLIVCKCFFLFTEAERYVSQSSENSGLNIRRAYLPYKVSGPVVMSNRILPFTEFSFEICECDQRLRLCH